jgi:hypothetical protein
MEMLRYCSKETMPQSNRPEALPDNGLPHYSDPIFNRRPEQLTVEEFVALTQMIENSR